MPVQRTNIIETSENCITYSFPVTWIIKAVLQTDTGIGVESKISRSGLINYESIQSVESIGVEMVGSSNIIVNQRGALISGATALSVGPGSIVSNSGQIISTGSDAEAVTADASFSSVGTAIHAPSGGLNFANTGTVFGHVLSRTDADDEIHNGGSIFGDVMLGKGEDLYDGRGGLIHGVVQGLGGADTIVGGDHDEAFDGGAGRDLIRGGRGDDAIDGGLDRILYNPETGVLKHDSNGDADGGVTIIARLDPGLALGHYHFEIV